MEAFDKPDGRLVEAEAIGNLPEARIRSCYSQTLPQLGWQSAGDGLFRREGEGLSLAVTREDAGGARVAFHLYPQQRRAAYRNSAGPARQKIVEFHLVRRYGVAL